MDELSDQVALVTGAGSGVGRAIAQVLAREGAFVVGVGRRLDRVQETMSTIEVRGDRGIARSVDVTDPEAVQAVVDDIVATHGRLDILVNNAALTGSGGIDNMPVLDIPLQRWRDVLDTNLTACFVCAQIAARVMVRAGSGNIVNISSIQGLFATRGSTDYASAKAGLIMLTRMLAGELAEFGIRVNAVAPGPVDLRPDAHVGAETWATLLGRMSLPRDIAEAVLFLVSARGQAIDGEVLAVDGGAAVRFREPPVAR